MLAGRLRRRKNKEDEMKFHHEPKMLLKLYRMRNKIDLSPEYQRGKVWAKDRRQLLLDSISKHMHVPAVYLRALDNDYYECVDGQQRLTAIFDFFDDKIELSKKYSAKNGGMLFSNLPQDMKDVFEDHELMVVELTNSTDDEIRELFDRLQRGMSLTSGERLHAKSGDLHDFADKISNHKYFGSVNIRDYRGAYHQISAQIICLEINGIVDVKFKNLEAMYAIRDFNSKYADKMKKISKVFGILFKAFPDKTPELHSRASIISLYLLISELDKNYAIKDKYDVIKAFIIYFERKIINAEEKENDLELIKYLNAISHSSDSANSIKTRHEIIMAQFLNYAKGIEPLDRKRGFTLEQRIIIYRNANGICQNKKCGKKVPWEKFDADHNIAYIHGGVTTVENGRLLCSSCNKKKGDSVVK